MMGYVTSHCYIISFIWTSLHPSARIIISISIYVYQLHMRVFPTFTKQRVSLDYLCLGDTGALEDTVFEGHLWSIVEDSSSSVKRQSDLLIRPQRRGAIGTW